MLQPKKSKHRKAFRGKIRGVAIRGSQLAFGEYGLRAVTGGQVSAKQIEAARKKLTFVTKRVGKYWVKIFPHKPMTLKPVGVKMGSGKGAVDRYVAQVKPGMILFEIDGVTEAMAKEAFTKAGHKISVQTAFVRK